jgi:hypothetical protein
MPIGRPAISRGFPSSEHSEEPVRLEIVEPAAASSPPPIVGESLAAVNARIEALERLTRLCEAGALTVDEFMAEKALILGHPQSNLAGSEDRSSGPITFHPATAEAAPRRSLLGRLGWFILPLGLAGGLGLAALTQPDAAARIWQEALRLFGV